MSTANNMNTLLEKRINARLDKLMERQRALEDQHRQVQALIVDQHQEAHALIEVQHKQTQALIEDYKKLLAVQEARIDAQAEAVEAMGKTIAAMQKYTGQ